MTLYRGQQLFSMLIFQDWQDCDETYAGKKIVVNSRNQPQLLHFGWALFVIYNKSRS